MTWNEIREVYPWLPESSDGWHQHGKNGGWVEGTATVAAGVTLGPSVVVGDDARIYGGKFLAGKFLGGTFYGGRFLGGAFHGGEYYGGTFLGDEFRGGAFYGGTFYSGTYRGGEYYGGRYFAGVHCVDGSR